MGIGGFLLKRLAYRFKMQDAYSFFELITRVGQPSKVDLPPDLFPMAGRMLARAAANQLVFQISRDWVLPFWAERQYTPGDPAFLPRMSWTSFNMTHRNWTAVGSLGKTREVTVDPRGLITPWFEGWSIDFWLVLDDATYFPSQTDADLFIQRPVDNMPVIESLLVADDAMLTTEVFGAAVRKVDTVMIRARVHNTSDQPIAPRLIMALRPYNPEGVAPVRSIRFTPSNLFEVNDRIGVLCSPEPSGVFCCDFRTGDCSHFLDRYDDRRTVGCSVGLASAFAEYRLRIDPGEQVEHVFLAPTEPRKPKPRAVRGLLSFDVAERRASTRSAWQKRADEGMSVSLPDQAVQDAFELNKSYLNLLDDGDCITPGVSTYHHYWFRDSAYLVAALDKMGYHDQARQKLANYPSRQKRNGFFLSQDGEWDSNGQALWTLIEHFRMTGDRVLLAKMFGSIVKGAEWIEGKTQETRDENSPHHGLLPAGFSAEHFGPNDYFYWDDFWALAGLRDAAFAARVLGRDDQAHRLVRMFDDLNANVRTSLRHVERKLGVPIMPASPYRRLDAGAIGCLCVVHPLHLMEPDDPLVINTTEQIRKRCFYGNGFFQDMIHAGVNVYLSLHVAQVYAARRDPYAWQIALDLLDQATPAGTWPEAINVNTGGGSMGDGMHGWAAADFLLFLRNTLIAEKNRKLVLTPCIPDTWTDWGRTIEVANAPTHFGPVSFRIEGGPDQVVLTLDPAWRTPPDMIEWACPHPGTSFLADGQRIPVGPEGVVFSPQTRQIRIGSND